MPYGTLHISDAIASSQQTVAQFGENNLFLEINNALTYHNKWVTDMTTMFCERTTDRLRLYGGIGDVVNEEMDEESRPDASKSGSGVNIGFRIGRFGSSMQWTRDYFRIATLEEVVGQTNAHADQDRLQIVRQIKRAFLTPTSSLSYRDKLASRQSANVVLPVRALLNADSTVVPQGPNGETFDASTHTHYSGTTSLTAANVTALIANVLEHGVPANLRLYINSAQEAAIRAMTGAGEFVAYVDARIRQPLSATFADGVALDTGNTGDRAIGIFGAAEVWVKPWMPASYLLCVDEGTGNIKPLAFRIQEDDPTLSDFTIRAEDESYPLRARTMARDFGVSVARRHMAAALFVGASSYTAPTI